MDLNMLMRDQARNNAQTELENAVTNGDAEAARKASEKLAQIAVANAPAKPPYSGDEIKSELEKLPWFGTDAAKSGRAMELGKYLDIKKFPTAAAFAKAVSDAVDAEFKKPAAGDDTEGDADDATSASGDGHRDANGEGDDNDPTRKLKKTDGPGERDATQRSNTRRSTGGPWTKLSDAPNETRADINRQMTKMLPSNATKEQKEGFVTRALQSHYQIHQRKAGK